VCHNVLSLSLSSFIPFCSFPSLSSTSIYLPSKSMCLIKPSAALKYWANMHSINACKCQPSIQAPSEYWRRCMGAPFRGFVYVCVRQIKAEGRTHEGLREEKHKINAFHFLLSWLQNGERVNCRKTDFLSIRPGGHRHAPVVEAMWGKARLIPDLRLNAFENERIGVVL